MPPLRIFLVEDNATIRDSLIPTLEELAAAQVVADAAGEDDSARWLAAHAGGWDLAVVDLFLAQGSGLGVLRHLRARSPSQRAVVLSNYATADMRRRCREARGRRGVRQVQRARGVHRLLQPPGGTRACLSDVRGRIARQDAASPAATP